MHADENGYLVTEMIYEEVTDDEMMASYAASAANPIKPTPNKSAPIKRKDDGDEKEKENNEGGKNKKAKTSGESEKKKAKAAPKPLLDPVIKIMVTRNC